MTIETNNNPEDIIGVIKTLFGVETLPEYRAELLDHSAKFTQDTMLQLMLYGKQVDWEWYENHNKKCGHRKIDSVIDAIYTYVRKPEYKLDDDDLDIDLYALYMSIRNRLSGTSGSNNCLQDSHKKIGDILQ